jgi:hypothetical protein
MHNQAGAECRLLRFAGRRCRLLRSLAGLVVAAVLGVAAPSSAQSISPLEFGPMLVWDGFNLQVRMGWKANWSAPLAQQFFAVDASWPRPPIGLTDEQRCSHQPYTNGGVVSVDILPPAPPGTYSVTITLKQCLFTNGAYQITPIATASGWGVINADGTFNGGSGTAPPQTQLEILPQTTRWRPQRDPAVPILVTFRGPATLDLSTVRLEVTPPAGLPNYTATYGAAMLVPGTTDQYTIAWTGPWQADDGTGTMAPLPAADYQVVVVGRAAGASTDSRSEPYDRVSLVEVTGVTWHTCTEFPVIDCPGGEARLAPNNGANGSPMPGGGQAVFPDAATAGGTFRKTLFARATIAPDLGADIAQVTVHFKMLDVDDPSASAPGSVDDDTTPAGAADNYSETASIEPSANVLLDFTVALAAFETSVTQGNNYRVVASTYEPWLAGFQADKTSQTGSLSFAGVTPQPSQAEQANQTSEMLTVWRTLHLELDRLDPQTDPIMGTTTQDTLDHVGTWTDLKRRSLRHRPNGILDAKHDVDDWVGGLLSVAAHAQDRYSIKDSSNDDVDVQVASGAPDLLNGQRARDITDRGYRLRDDELAFYLSTTHDTAMLSGLLEPLYIAVERHHGDAVNPQTLLPWTEVMLSDVGAGPRDVASSPPYWVVQVILAFQGRLGNAPDALRDTRIATHDPSDFNSGTPARPSYSGGVQGVTFPGGQGAPAARLRQPRSLSFVETIRDFMQTNTTIGPTVSLPDALSSNLAHEVFHALTLFHDGGIMCSKRKINAADPMRFSLTEPQKTLLRRIDGPLWTNPADVLCAPGSTAPTCCP